MALDSINKEQFSFKKLVGKAHTQFSFADTEESISSNIQISFVTIFGEEINPLPATDGGLVNTGDTDNIVEKLRFEVEIIPDTFIGTNQSQGYRLKLPTNYSGVLSPKFSGGTFLHTALGNLQVVSPLNGTLKSDGTTEYDPVLLQTNGVTEISKFDPINWNLDYYNGILFVQDPPSNYDISATRPGFVEAFLYVGSYLNQVVTGATGSSGVTVSNQGTGQGVGIEGPASNVVSLRSLVGSGNTNILTQGNEIIIFSTGNTGTTTLGAANGLSIQSGNVVLGGTLTGNTIISASTFGLGIGCGIITSGQSSFAQGFCTNAIGNFSHAEGGGSCSIGIISHAEGLLTLASGYSSHAEGRCTCAIGGGSHSEGNNTRAFGSYSHAEGNCTCSIGSFSHAEGRFTCSIGNVSHAEGRFTEACGYASHASGCGFSNRRIIATGIGSFNHSNNNSSQGLLEGANANFSAILGGLNHNIEVGNTGATIIGGSGIKLVGTNYVNTTAVDNLAIISTPVSGTSADNILVRNASTGIIREVTQESISGGSTLGADNGLSIQSGNIVLGGSLTGDTLVDTSNNGIGFGNNVLACGNESFAIGRDTQSLSLVSFAQGLNTIASGISSHAEGNATCAVGNASHAEGVGSVAFAATSHAEGGNTRAYGIYSHTEGAFTCTIGNSSHAGGRGFPARRVLASGCASFNHSFNTLLQGVAHGANGDYSAILGGINHNIESGNTGATVIGGNSIKLTGTTYVDTTAVGKLAIINSPAIGTAINNVLVRDASTGIIREVTQESIGGGTGGTGTTLGAANGLSIQSGNIVLGGPLTGSTVINMFNNSLAIGNYSTSVGQNSIAFGCNTCASGNNSLSEGTCTIASGQSSHAEGFITCAIGVGAHSEGFRTSAFGSGSHSGGISQPANRNILACGFGSFNHSTNTVSQELNHGANADFSAILAGQDHNIESGNTGATIIGGTSIKLTGVTYVNTTAVDNLAIISTPVSGSTGDSVLVRDSITGIIKEVPQESVGTTLGATNGLSIQSGNVVLGGTLTGNTNINSSFGLSIGNNATATGNSSVAFGQNTIAGGISSHAHGYNSCSIGFSSHAEGNGTQAFGAFSHSEGITTRACSNFSHSEGNATCAIGSASHSEGLSTFASGSTSHSEGLTTRAYGNQSHSEGNATCAIGNASHSEGLNTKACGNQSHSEGNVTCAIGNGSHSEGLNTRAFGNYSHSKGVRTIASGYSSHVGGIGNSLNRNIIAAGCASFNHSRNTTGQTIGHGANANFSAILAGQDHNIESGNTGATIIGGNGIKLTGVTYVNTTAVDNLAIISTPVSGSTGDNVLVRNSSTGLIREVAQNDLNVDTLGATNGLSVQSGNIVLGGSLTGNTVINSNNNGLAFGFFATATGNNSFAQGYVSNAVGNDSNAEGRFTSACGYGSHAEGNNTTAYGDYSHVEGQVTMTCAIASHAEGSNTMACGNASHSEGTFTVASGASSRSSGSGINTRRIIAGGVASFNHSRNTAIQLPNHGANACGSAILGGQDHNIELGNVNAVIIGGNAVKLTGTTYIDTTVVDNFGIFSTPSNGTTNDNVLVRDASTGIIREVTQSSIGGGGTGGTGTTLGAANGLSIQSENIVLGGSLTGNTVILGSTFGFGIGSVVTATGNSSIAFGCNTRAFGNYSLSQGDNTCASGLSSHAEGLNTCSINNFSHAEGNGTRSFGNSSHSEGSNTCSIGIGSHSEGNNTRSYGSSSHAEGNNTRSCGGYSHSEGRFACSIGVGSHAEGFFTIASGQSSHSEGRCTCSIGVYSHAEGGFTATLGNYSHSEGNNTCAIGVGSHSEGLNTRALGNYSHVGGLGIVNRPIITLGCGSFNHSRNTTGQTLNHGANANNSTILGGQDHNIESGNTGATVIGGNGIKLTGTSYVDTTALSTLAIMSTPVSGSTGDSVLVRDSSTGIIKEVSQSSIGGGTGGTTLTSSNGINIEGNNIVLGGCPLTRNTTIPTSTFGLGIGNNVIATGNSSLAIGEFSRAIDNNSFAVGFNSCASGCTSFAAGQGTRAIGVASFAQGFYSFAFGNRSHSEGRATCSIGPYSHTEGCLTRAFGNFSHAEGSITYACGLASHSEGRQVFVIGCFSHGEGHVTCAIGNASHSEGYCTNAIGNNSHSEGYCTNAIGNNSHSAGVRTSASGFSSHVSGFGVLNRPIITLGCGSFNHSVNNSGQTISHGANAYASAILGGLNHNIESGNTGATIIGGNGIKLVGTNYINTTAVDNLAIMSTPVSGTTNDNVLVRNASTGIIREVSQSSIGGGGTGSTLGAANGLSIQSGNVVLGGTLTGNTTISASTFAFGIGSNVCASGSTSFSFGNQSRSVGNESVAIGYIARGFGYRSISIASNSTAYGDYSIAIGTSSCAFNNNSLAIGYTSEACATQSTSIGNGSVAYNTGSTAIGNSPIACGLNSTAIGLNARAFGTCSLSLGFNEARACGVGSFAFGERAYAIGNCSISIGFGNAGGRSLNSCGSCAINFSYNTVAQTVGHGANGCGSAIFGGRNHNIESGNTRATIIGGNGIKLTGITYIDTTALSTLAIMSTPVSGSTGDSVLVRDSSTGLIREISQNNIGGGPLSPSQRITVLNSVTGSTTMDFESSDKFKEFKLVLNENTTVSFLNDTNRATYKIFLEISGASRTITFPSSVEMPSSTNNISGVTWTTATQNLQIPVGKFEIGGDFDGTTDFVKMSDIYT